MLVEKKNQLKIGNFFKNTKIHLTKKTRLLQNCIKRAFDMFNCNFLWLLVFLQGEQQLEICRLFNHISDFLDVPCSRLFAVNHPSNEPIIRICYGFQRNRSSLRYLANQTACCFYWTAVYYTLSCSYNVNPYFYFFPPLMHKKTTFQIYLCSYFTIFYINCQIFSLFLLFYLPQNPIHFLINPFFINLHFFQKFLFQINS